MATSATTSVASRSRARSGRTLLAALLLSVAVSAQAEPKKRTGGDSYIVLPTLTASVFSEGGGRGVLTVEVGLDATDPAMHKRAVDSLPRLQDGYTQVLAIQGSAISPGRAPNVEALAVALQRETDRIVGRPGVKLLLGTVMVN